MVPAPPAPRRAARPAGAQPRTIDHCAQTIDHCAQVPRLVRGLCARGARARLGRRRLRPDRARQPRNPECPPPPSRTTWTRLVHPSVLIGHVSAGRARRACAAGARSYKEPSLLAKARAGAVPWGAPRCSTDAPAPAADASLDLSASSASSSDGGAARAPPPEGYSDEARAWRDAHARRALRGAPGFHRRGREAAPAVRVGARVDLPGGASLALESVLGRGQWAVVYQARRVGAGRALDAALDDAELAALKARRAPRNARPAPPSRGTQCTCGV